MKGAALLWCAWNRHPDRKESHNNPDLTCDNALWSFVHTTPELWPSRQSWLGKCLFIQKALTMESGWKITVKWLYYGNHDVVVIRLFITGCVNRRVPVWVTEDHVFYSNLQAFFIIAKYVRLPGRPLQMGVLEWTWDGRMEITMDADWYGSLESPNPVNSQCYSLHLNSNWEWSVIERRGRAVETK